MSMMSMAVEANDAEDAARCAKMRLYNDYSCATAVLPCWHMANSIVRPRGLYLLMVCCYPC